LSRVSLLAAIGAGWRRSIRCDSREEERSMNAHERPVVTEANKTAVRAGSTGNNVRYVLIASCALVIIAFIAIALFVKP
jgi:Flp pilus assembly protein TadB